MLTGYSFSHVKHLLRAQYGSWTEGYGQRQAENWKQGHEYKQDLYRQN